MQYDVIINTVGTDQLSVALALMNSIQQQCPLPLLDTQQVWRWLAHTPILLRRGTSYTSARDLKQRYEQLGAAISITPTRLFFPADAPGISRWRNEWFSEHLSALHEVIFADWARATHVYEGYRFSFLPSMGVDMAIRLWKTRTGYYASARRSIGCIGPLPGPPVQVIGWSPIGDEWQQLRQIIDHYHFWGSDSWNTVPEGHIVMDTTHWLIEGWHQGQYHVLADQTPDEGAAREVGVLLFDLLPDEFKQRQTDE